jgi:hypothetical protein
VKKNIYTLSALAAATMFVLPSIVFAQATEPMSTVPAIPSAQSDVQGVSGLSSQMSAAEAMSALAGDPVAADVLAGEDALSEVSIDVNPTNPDNQVIVGHDAGLVTMNTFYTMDGGLTWTPVVIDNATDGLTSTFRFDPTVAFDDDGNVYVGYGARTANPTGGNQRVVVVCRSTDGGASYPRCTNISTTADIGTLPGNDKWHLATGPDPSSPSQQNVYIAWTQNITEATGLDQRIVVSRSIDGGATFSAPVIINDPSIAGSRSGNLFADPAVGPLGELYVAWHDIDAGQVWIDRSFDGGLTFGTDVLVTNSTAGFKTSIPAQPDRGVGVMPTIDTDRSGGPYDGRIYLAYSDLGAGGGADFNVLVMSSSDGGVTWTAPVIVHDDGGTNSQFLPWLDVDQQTGQVVSVWYDARNDVNNKKVEVFLAASDDGGVTWRPNVLVSDSPSDMSVDNSSRYLGNFLEYIGVASLGGTAFPVWADNSESGGDLDYYTDQVPIGSYEIWGWKESQISRDFIADGGDWEALGLGIDAGDVLLDTVCSAEQVSCQKGVDCPPNAPAGTGIDGPLNVSLLTQDGYVLSEIHMDAEESPSAFPQTKNGNPRVGQFETQASWDVLSPASGWSSDTDDSLSDGNTSYIALHGKVFVPNGCTVNQGDGYYALCSRTAFDTAVEACQYELQKCSGESAWADGTQFVVGKRRNWAMYMEVDASDFCSFEKICDSSDGANCN